MSIQFYCTHCSSELRVADENAGKSARCPSCQSIIQVPDAAGLQNRDVAPPLSGNPFAASREETALGKLNQNPFSSPRSDLSKIQQKPEGTLQPTPVEIGTILNYAWKIWQENLGLLVGATAIFFGISFAISFTAGIFQNIAMQMGNRNLLVIGQFALTFLSNLVQVFLGIGLTRIVLNLCRQRTTDLGMLFSGADRFLPVLGTSILAGLALMIGFLLLVIPGVMLLLLFWPFYFLVVDKQCPAMQSFAKGYEIARPNMLTTFLMILTGFGIILAGFLALCVGILFAAPLVNVMWCTAYLMMKGELSSLTNANQS